ncbi:hypothetical protein ACWC4E_09045 [Streptomyces sp. NPDC001273]|uniref:hypothetical protein n=1 Tax=unclassified Streptomyces TaxID=2593676 RepID=UPI0033E8FAFF
MDPQHSRSLEPSAAEMLRARYASRLPKGLDELTGPAHGQVELPLHVARSGLRAYDLDRPRQRMSLYRTVLAEGRRQDLLAFLNRDLLNGAGLARDGDRRRPAVGPPPGGRPGHRRGLRGGRPQGEPVGRAAHHRLRPGPSPSTT